MSGKFYLCQIMAKYIQLTILWIFSGINIAGSSVAWMWKVGQSHWIRNQPDKPHDHRISSEVGYSVRNNSSLVIKHFTNAR